MGNACLPPTPSAPVPSQRGKTPLKVLVHLFRNKRNVNKIQVDGEFRFFQAEHKMVLLRYPCKFPTG